MRESIAKSTTGRAAQPQFAEAQDHQQGLDGRIRDLQRQISALMSEHRDLQQVAGAAESHHQGQINSLMMMIASLGGSINATQRDTPDYARVSGRIETLASELATRRGYHSRESAQAQQELGELTAQQASLQQALAQILQQLTSLHLRMGALKPLV